MFLPILSGLVVSVDAFFIGLSLGMRQRCRFLYLVVINAFLFGLCVLGFFLAGRVYELIPIDPDWLVGIAFIALGIWTIAQYFVAERQKQRAEENPQSGIKTIVLVGLVMSVEAMLITMGLTILFAPDTFFVIPVVVAAAHFGYSAISFFLARSKYAKRIPVILSYVISGVALIVYGLMALFVETAI
ncbi:MAG: manganese efflux pump [Defluviitaleaceae bacterium]|nr:manganese efflux pump [Defluviitaleaceae bacterium]